MKLKEVRKTGIKYCNENNCNYTLIAYDEVEEFYLTTNDERHAVFVVGKNGSLKPYKASVYSVNFHKERKRRKNSRKKNGKRKITDMYNKEYEQEEE